MFKGLGLLLLLILSSFGVYTIISKLKTSKKSLFDLGVVIPKILIPKNLDTTTWSTIAVDQYTQNEEYWQNVSTIVGEKPSAFKITFPEIYLKEDDNARQQRITNIHQQMTNYLNEGIFEEAREEFVYLERTTRYGRVRHGLNIAIDLERYEYKPFSQALIRSTEATIESRLPTRVAIRKDAPIEIPHIMVLVNDPDHKLIEGLGEIVKSNKPLYQGDLMLNSGSVQGWSVSSKDDLEYFRANLEKLAKSNTQKDGSIFLFAVGDGNHSLATAKATWEQFKKDHPGITDGNLRYALIEIVNIYDSGLTFEPIHRVLMNINSEKFVNFMKEKLDGTLETLASFEDLKNKIENSKSDLGFIYKKDGNEQFILLKTNIKELLISQLQPAIDDYLAKEETTGQIDFIHGADEIYNLGQKDGYTSVYLPAVDKESFFATISEKGPLPRKSFSMGEADEKKFYLECREIKIYLINIF